MVRAVVAALVGASGAAAQDADLEGVGFLKGDADAPVTVVEYADFACSACAQFARDVWPTIDRDFVQTGRVLWRLVPFELGFPNSAEGARAAQCAAELGAFWTMHDLLFARQSEWEGERRPKDRLAAIAVEAGMDSASFLACYDDDRGKDRTRAANRAARADRVRGTPTFLIDGFRVQGALPVEDFVELIESALAGGLKGSERPWSSSRRWTR